MSIEQENTNPAVAEKTAAAEKKIKPAPKRGILFGVGIFFCVLFGMILLCNLTIIIKGAIAPDRPASIFGFTPMAVKSGSMSGTADGHIEVGDLIIVCSADPDKLVEGDVIAFMDGSIVVTHRIVAVQTEPDGSRSFITKGDANNTQDSAPVTENNLVGICKMRIPHVGDVVLSLQKPVVMVFVIGLPLLLLAIWEISRRQKEINEERRQKAEVQKELDRLRYEQTHSDAPDGE